MSRSSIPFIRIASLALLALVSLAPSTAYGQADADLLRRTQRQLRDLDEAFRLKVPEDQPLIERLLIDYGGSARFAFLAVDDNFSNTRILRQSQGIAYISAELDGAHRFYARANLLYDDFNSGDSFDGRGDDLNEPIVDVYWYSFDLRRAHLAKTGELMDKNLNIRAGRQFVNWGSGLALSNIIYSGIATAEWGRVSVTGLAGLTPTSGTIDFDGSRPSFDTNTQRAYWGGRLEVQASAQHRPYAFALVQNDQNERDFAVITTNAGMFPTRFNYDSQYYGIGSQGNFGPHWTYRVELVHERGRGLSNSFDSALNPIPQTREDIEAWAGVASLSYLFLDEKETRLDLEVVMGSGDDDRIDSGDTFGGNRTGTTDRSFNTLGFIDTGLALGPEVANLMCLRASMSTSPAFYGTRSDSLRLRLSGFLFGKVDKDAPMNIPTTDHSFVGGEIDASADWRITSDLTATIRYGVFLDGDAIPRGQDDPRHFGLVSLTYAF